VNLSLLHHCKLNVFGNINESLTPGWLTRVAVTVSDAPDLEELIYVMIHAVNVDFSGDEK